MKTCVPTKSCTWMFIATSFETAPNRKQAQCPSTGVWINRDRSIQGSTAQQKKNGMSHPHTIQHGWVLNNYAEREKPNKKRIRAPWFHRCKILRDADSSNSDRTDQWLPGGDGPGWAWRGDGCIVLMKVMVPQVCACIRTCQIVHFYCVSNISK